MIPDFVTIKTKADKMYELEITIKGQTLLLNTWQHQTQLTSVHKFMESLIEEVNGKVATNDFCSCSEPTILPGLNPGRCDNCGRLVKPVPAVEPQKIPHMTEVSKGIYTSKFCSCFGPKPSGGDCLKCGKPLKPDEAGSMRPEMPPSGEVKIDFYRNKLAHLRSQVNFIENNFPELVAPAAHSLPTDLLERAQSLLTDTEAYIRQYGIGSDSRKLVSAKYIVSRLKSQPTALWTQLVKEGCTNKCYQNTLDSPNQFIEHDSNCSNYLKECLDEAIKEIEEHNKDYHHITNKEKLDKWKSLANENKTS